MPKTCFKPRPAGLAALRGACRRQAQVHLA